MNVNIDLLSRYQSAFGYVARNGVGAIVTSATSIAEATAMQEARAAYMRNWMTVHQPSLYAGETGESLNLFERGDATFADITLESAKTNTLIKFAITESMEALEGVLAPPPMVTFERTKNIKTTIIDNSDYEVVECFGTQSWQITFEGILVDMTNHWYPGDLVKQFRKIFEVNDTFEICGQIFEDMGIEQIYFTDLPDLSFVKDYNDTLKFKLKAKSIKPAEFFL